MPRVTKPYLFPKDPGLLPGEFDLLYQLKQYGPLAPGEFDGDRAPQNRYANLERLRLRGLVANSTGSYRLTDKAKLVLSL